VKAFANPKLRSLDLKDDTMRQTSMITQLLTVLPAAQQAKFMALAAQQDLTDAQWEAAVQETLTGLDCESFREQIGALLNQLLPLEQLVPEVYREWQAVVRDTVTFMGRHLSSSRLVPKLVTQLLLPADLPVEQRVTMLIARMPGLQKLGQIVARNQHLDPAVRHELTQQE
jgi:hypothetical protein